MKTITIHSHQAGMPPLTLTFDDALMIVAADVKLQFIKRSTTGLVAPKPYMVVKLSQNHLNHPGEILKVNNREGFTLLAKNEKGIDVGYEFKHGLVALKQAVAIALKAPGNHFTQAITHWNQLDVRNPAYQWTDIQKGGLAWVNENGEAFTNLNAAPGQKVKDEPFKYLCTFDGRSTPIAFNGFASGIYSIRDCAPEPVIHKEKAVIVEPAMFDNEYEDVIQKAIASGCESVTIFCQYPGLLARRPVDLPMSDVIAIARAYNEKRFDKEDKFDIKRIFSDKKYQFGYLKANGSAYIKCYGGGPIVKAVLPNAGVVLHELLYALGDHKCQSVTKAGLMPNEKYANYYRRYAASLDNPDKNVRAAWIDNAGSIITGLNIETEGKLEFTHAVDITRAAYKTTFCGSSNMGKLRYTTELLEKPDEPEIQKPLKAHPKVGNIPKNRFSQLNSCTR